MMYVHVCMCVYYAYMCNSVIACLNFSYPLQHYYRLPLQVQATGALPLYLQLAG